MRGHSPNGPGWQPAPSDHDHLSTNSTRSMIRGLWFESHGAHHARQSELLWINRAGTVAAQRELTDPDDPAEARAPSYLVGARRSLGANWAVGQR